MNRCQPTALMFKALCDFPRGTISSLLVRSYSACNSVEPGLIREWERAWQEYDDDVHRHPDTVGQSGFVSCVGDAAIGFGSWDPRPFPTAQIGHNCILPACRGMGYGTVQLKHITELLRWLGFSKALARTGDIEFFAPARKMYEACGFIAAATCPPGPAAPFSLTQYELILRGAPARVSLE